MTADLAKRMALVLRIAADPECARSELALASALLLKFYNGRTGRCDPGKRALAAATATHERSVVRSIRQLERLGYFEITVRGGTATKHGATNAYTPLFDRIMSMSPDDAHAIPDGVTPMPSDDMGGKNGVTPVPSKPVIKPSVAKATGADAPTREVLVFRQGKMLLGKNAGGQITKLRKAFGGDDVAVQAILIEAEAKENPAEWIAGVIRRRGDPPELDELGLPKIPISELGGWTDDYYRRLGVER